MSGINMDKENNEKVNDGDENDTDDLTTESPADSQSQSSPKLDQKDNPKPITIPSLVISSPENTQSVDSGDVSDEPSVYNKDGDSNVGINGGLEVPGNGPKRVRFSICEYITETLVQENGVNGSHENPTFENDEGGMGNGKSKDSDMETGGSKVRYIGGKLRRDSVHPLVPFHAQLIGKTNPWDVDNPMDDDEKDIGTPWSDLNTKQRILRVLIGIGKFLGLLGLLYFFVCSLDVLALGFRLVGGRTAGEIFRQSSILQNPVVGLMIGILTTVLVQSSSTSTSIIVGMVAAGFMDVRIAIPPIMGANIGTSITNTIVSFTQASDRNQFRRAFAGATVLDMFNWITVIVLLPIEVLFGYLYHVSKASVDLIIPDSQSGGEIQVLSVITKPFVDLIIQLNDTVLECWATPNCTDADEASLIRDYCSTSNTEIIVQERVVDVNGNELFNMKDVARQEDLRRCDFLFAGTSLSDAAVGAIVLVSSLVVLCFCLVMIVKLLNSVLKGHVSKIIKHTLNANIPYVPWITGYIAILIGAVMTFLVQSSSVFTSALTPLVGMGVISLNRVYPLTLGANIGTTTTALLASMAADGKQLYPSLQIALCHFFFNITGVLLFYPIPFLRFPIGMAKALGNITAKYRWFAIFYLVCMFAALPVVFIALSLAGSIYVIVLVSAIAVIVFLKALLTVLQRKFPQILPDKLQDWKFMPAPLRSLKPYDNLISKMPCCPARTDSDDDGDSSDDDDGGFSRKSSVYTNNDFIYLTGNKIPPPPSAFIIKNGEKIAVSPTIMRIVPTRVIRNISNGNGNDYQPVNGKGSGDSPNANGSPVQINKELSPKSAERSAVQPSQNGGTVTSYVGSNMPVHNTVPAPTPIGDDESPDKSMSSNGINVSSVPSNSGESNGLSNNMAIRSPNPSVNLSYSDSSESFSV